MGKVPRNGKCSCYSRTPIHFENLRIRPYSRVSLEIMTGIIQIFGASRNLASFNSGTVPLEVAIKQRQQELEQSTMMVEQLVSNTHKIYEMVQARKDRKNTEKIQRPHQAAANPMDH